MKSKAYFAAKARDYYHRRKEAGRCARCASPAQRGGVLCRPCRDDLNEAQRRRYRAKVTGEDIK